MLASYVDSIAHKCDIEIDASRIHPTQDVISATTGYSSNLQSSNTTISSEATPSESVPTATTIPVIPTTTISTESTNITGKSNNNEREKDVQTNSTQSISTETISPISSSSVCERVVTNCTIQQQSYRSVPEASQEMRVENFVEGRDDRNSFHAQEKKEGQQQQQQQ